MKVITLYQKAAAIAIKLEEMAGAFFRPEWVLRKATAEQIDFYYERIYQWFCRCLFRGFGRNFNKCEY